MVTPTAIAMKSRRRAQCSATNTAQQIRLIQSAVTDTILTLIGMALCSMKPDIYVPSFGWFISHLYSLSLLRRNSAAASRSRGVVGSTGRKAPNIPNPRDMSPRMVRNMFTVYSPGVGLGTAQVSAAAVSSGLV